MGLKKQPPNIHKGVIYPRFYFYRRGVSDRNWILSRMQIIPQDKQAEVAEEYERKYLAANNQARKTANTWLNGVAMEYRVS